MLTIFIMITHFVVVSLIITVISGEGMPLVLPVPGIVLQNATSAVCTEVSLSDIDNFILCSFIQFGKSHGSHSTLFKLWNYNDTFELIFNYNHLIINYKEKRYTYPKGLPFNKWFKICVTVNNASKIKLEIKYSTFRNDLVEASMEENSEDQEKILKTTKQMTNFDDFPSQLMFSDFPKISTSIAPEVHLCLGSNKTDKISTVAAFALTTVSANSDNERKMYIVTDSCFLDSYKESHLAYSANSGSSQLTYGVVEKKSFSLIDICFDIHGFVIFNDSSNYDEHVSRCQILNGRLIKEEEFEICSERLNETFVNKTNWGKNENNDDDYVWLEGGTKGASSFSVFCPVYGVIVNTSMNLPCIFELSYNFCIMPIHSDFFLFTSLIKYDWHYLSHVLNSSIIFEGDEGSRIEKKGDNWVLYSLLHKEYATLTNATIPIGRNMWKYYDQKEFILTFTSCNSDHFSCSNGECLILEARCNGTVECLDASDEENCVLINKRSGYLINRVPPPRNNESIFNIRYFIQVLNIADISTSDGIAVVNAAIDLTWFDPRITFENPVIDEEINCHEIWAPQLSMADSVLNGFEISYKPRRTGCVILSSKYVTAGDTRRMRLKLERNSYNGYYIEGKDLPISYMFAGLITVPCRFDLRKYPFGIQTCNITLWLDNAIMTSSNYKMESHYPLNMNINDSNSSELNYGGKLYLGEFFLLNLTHTLQSSSQYVVLTLKLQTLFGYHMLNSFTPSILISVIAYCSLFFSLENFNERVMVSLTALLVLAALFTQSSNTSVKTPYFKYLDIWYVVLIIFCFFIVIANMMLHKLSLMKIEYLEKIHHLKSDEKEGEFQEEKNGWLKKMNNINNILEISFFIILFIFVMTYILGALDII